MSYHITVLTTYGWRLATGGLHRFTPSLVVLKLKFKSGSNFRDTNRQIRVVVVQSQFEDYVKSSPIGQTGLTICISFCFIVRWRVCNRHGRR